MKRMKTLFAASLLALGTWTMAGAGCAALEDTGCATDADCRFGRVCFEGVCTGDAQAPTNNSGNNGATNNSTANNAGNNGTTNNGNNGSTNNGNNGNIGQPCRPTGNCGDNATCSEDGECVPTCEDSSDCDAAVDICLRGGCVEPRPCMLLEVGTDPTFCAALWDCAGAEVGVFCEIPPDGQSFCFCFDGETGAEQMFTPDGPVSCDSDRFVSFANSECQLRVPEE